MLGVRPSRALSAQRKKGSDDISRLTTNELSELCSLCGRDVRAPSVSNLVPAMRIYYYRHLTLALALLLLVLNLCLITSAQTPKPTVIFEEVRPGKSGINWVHNNAHSTDRYLPETVGAGCAFFDYDNDGWMDIYLVNSGPSDFYSPSIQLKNALYHNNHDGTFTDATDKAGVAGGTFGMGVV